MRSFLFILLIFIYCSQTVSSQVFSEKKNCFINTKSEYFNGETKEDHHSFYFQNKKECEELKKIFSNNFSPKEIKKNKVDLKWNDI
jgi:hypothetical protein